MQFGDAASAIFHLDGYVEGITYPSLSPAQQDSFKADFFRELASLQKWCRQESWPPSPPADLQIFVSDEYKIAKSLVPAALGQRGRMELPAWKAIAGEAAIMHELVHIYFPNGNRFLAEGLAIYLQDKIGGNPTFPNFGRPLHQVARELLQAMLPGLSSGRPESLDKIHLTHLDKIATPSPLRLRVGRDLYENTPTGQAHLYPIAGSFAQFLIEARGVQMFRKLYEQTPLIPMERNPGSPDRWVDAYGVSLAELELEWKSIIVGG
jgi:hypothetical protein